MDADEQDISDRLTQAAEQAMLSFPRPDVLAKKVSRRRQLHTLAAAAVSGLVIIAAVMVVRSFGQTSRAVVTADATMSRVSPPSTSEDSTPYWSASSAAPSPAVGEGAPGAAPSQIRHFVCGGRIDSPIVLGNTYGSVSAKIETVHTIHTFIAEATVVLTTTEPKIIKNQLGPTKPRILILKNGVIVAEQDSAVPIPSPHNVAKNLGPANTITLDPTHPYRFIVRTHNWVHPCGGLTLDQLWSGDGYQLVVIMSTAELDTPPQGYAAGPDLLLTASVPLKRTS